MGIVGSQKARFAAIFLLPAIAAGVVPASVVAQAAPGADAPMQMRLAALPPSPGPDGPGEDALATRVVSDYVALTANASADDVEAGVVFAVSQSKLSSDAAIAGLSRAARVADAKLLAAINEAIAAIKAGKLKTGTGALGSNTNDSGFSGPTVNVGGGSSNYSGE